MSGIKSRIIEQNDIVSVSRSAIAEKQFEISGDTVLSNDANGTKLVYTGSAAITLKFDATTLKDGFEVFVSNVGSATITLSDSTAALLVILDSTAASLDSTNRRSVSAALVANRMFRCVWKSSVMSVFELGAISAASLA